MTPAEWRALIEAYLEARLSPEAFARRFLEGLAAARAAGAPVPSAIGDFSFAVEAFDAAAQGADQGASDDDDMCQGARRALRELTSGAPMHAHTFDRTRAREDMRRFTFQFTGCAGLGCAIALIWIGLCVLQVYFVVEWVADALHWGALPSTLIGLVLAFVPIIGNILAFLGWTAKDLPAWVGAILFFAAPAATLISGWARWRRYRR